jgi:hypothetical protein
MTAIRLREAQLYLAKPTSLGVSPHRLRLCLNIVHLCRSTDNEVEQVLK